LSRFKAGLHFVDELITIKIVPCHEPLVIVDCVLRLLEGLVDLSAVVVADGIGFLHQCRINVVQSGLRHTRFFFSRSRHKA